MPALWAMKVVRKRHESLHKVATHIEVDGECQSVV